MFHVCVHVFATTDSEPQLHSSLLGQFDMKRSTAWHHWLCKTHTHLFKKIPVFLDDVQKLFFFSKNKTTSSVCQQKSADQYLRLEVWSRGGQTGQSKKNDPKILWLPKFIDPQTLTDCTISKYCNAKSD